MQIELQVGGVETLSKVQSYQNPGYSVSVDTLEHLGNTDVISSICTYPLLLCVISICQKQYQQQQQTTNMFICVSNAWSNDYFTLKLSIAACFHGRTELSAVLSVVRSTSALMVLSQQETTVTWSNQQLVGQF